MKTKKRILFALGLVAVCAGIHYLPAEAGSKMRVILPMFSAITTPQSGELAFDPSTNGPVLYHAGAWRTVKPVTRLEFPALKVTASQVTLSGKSGIVLASGKIHLIESPLSVASSSITDLAAGWNALFVYENESGGLSFTRSADFYTPDDMDLSTVVSNGLYRYVGSIYVTSAMTSALMPMTRRGGQYYYNQSITVPSPMGSPPYTWTLSSTPPRAQILKVAGSVESVNTGFDEVANLADNFGGTLYNASPVTTKTYGFDAISLIGSFPSSGSAASFVLKYTGTLSNVYSRGHVEEDVAFLN